jgi:hypothetical protein
MNIGRQVDTDRRTSPVDYVVAARQTTWIQAERRSRFGIWPEIVCARMLFATLEPCTFMNEHTGCHYAA